MIMAEKQFQSALVHLEDEEMVILDNSGKTPAYFCRRKPVSVTKDLICELKDMCVAAGGVVRLCLHESPEAEHHDMVVVQHVGQCFIPHRHQEREETFHIIEGELGVFIFSEEGEIVVKCRMSAEGNLIYGIGENLYHAYIPISEMVVFREFKSGPFTSENNFFAPWGPDKDDKEAMQCFVTDLLRLLPHK